MLNNHTQEIRECYQQAAHCVQQAEAQNDSKVKKQFLELTRLCCYWRTVTSRHRGAPHTANTQKLLLMMV
jgi:hypothetical protein